MKKFFIPSRVHPTMRKLVFLCLGMIVTIHVGFWSITPPRRVPRISERRLFFNNADSREVVVSQRILNLTTDAQTYKVIKVNSKNRYEPVRIPDAYFNSVSDINAFKTNLALGRQKSILDVARKRYLINCSNIHEIKLGRFLGKGFFKAARYGTFRGIPVALKTIVKQGKVTWPCIETIMGALKDGSLANIATTLHHTHCKRPEAMGILIEIINHAVLSYPNIVRNLGYCLRRFDEGKNVTDFEKQEIVSVFEYGTPISIAALKELPWDQRLQHCRELAHLMELLQNSLLGPVAYRDFLERHFVMADGSIKLIDMDFYVKSIEPRCKSNDIVLRPHRYHYVNCSYNITCHKGFCKGENALFNIHNFTDMFFLPLLNRTRLPPEVYDSLLPIITKIGRYEATGAEIGVELDRVMKTFSNESEFG